VSVNPVEARVEVEKVSFSSAGVQLVGDLHRAAGPGPAVVVTGSWTTVKEQMATRYAAGLAERGVSALAVDFRGWGESGGEPRELESPGRKAEDIAAAAGYLADRGDLGGAVGALGVCAGAGYTAVAAAGSSVVRSVAMVAPWLHDRSLVPLVYGGEEGVERLLARGEAARARYRATGEVEYVPAVSAEDPDAAMYGPFDYYLDAARGAVPRWPNRFAVMGWTEWLTFDPIAVAPRVGVPTLLVHSEEAALPDGARRFHAALGGPGELRWATGTQFDFYDSEPVVGPALDAVAEHFRSTL
jgi:fermentation-respiration switch protein FrsA (DUF1100 family)